MKLCQENTELAEKLKSIIDQYELREEVRTTSNSSQDSTPGQSCLVRGRGSVKKKLMASPLNR